MTRTDQRHIPHHRTSCPGHKLGELSGKEVSLGWEEDIGQLVVSKCIVHHLGVFFFLFLLSLLLLLFTITLFYFIFDYDTVLISTYKFCLDSPCDFPAVGGKKGD